MNTQQLFLGERKNLDALHDKKDIEQQFSEMIASIHISYDREEAGHRDSRNNLLVCVCFFPEREKRNMIHVNQFHFSQFFSPEAEGADVDGALAY